MEPKKAAFTKVPLRLMDEVKKKVVITKSLLRLMGGPRKKSLLKAF